MKLKYYQVTVELKFKEPVEVDNYPLFVVRGLIGKGLREICCENKNGKCNDCLFVQSCFYANFFETIVEKDQGPKKGSDRYSHPFALTGGDFHIVGKTIGEYKFELTVFGDSIKNLRYIYKALEIAGKEGMFGGRVPFSVEMYDCNGKLISDGKLGEESAPVKIFDMDEVVARYDQFSFDKIRINMETPLLFKTNGKYADDFTAEDFFRSLNRRLEVMMTLYGDEQNSELIEKYNPMKIHMTDVDLRWESCDRYSGRQKVRMSFGGVGGSFSIHGNFGAYEMMLLEFAGIANGGKRTNFGQGRIRAIVCF